MSEPILSARNEQTDNALLLSRGYGTVPKAVMQDRRLPPAAKALYAYLCSFAGRGGVAFPGVEKITYDMAMGRDAYYAHMNRLRALGYVRVQRAANAGRFARNTYTLTHGEAPAPQPEPAQTVPDSEIPFAEPYAEEPDAQRDAAVQCAAAKRAKPTAEEPSAQEPPAASTSAESPCAAQPYPEKPCAEKPHPGIPAAENPAANNNSPNNNRGNNNPKQDEDEWSTAHTRARAQAQSERERAVALMVRSAAAVLPDGAGEGAQRLFAACFGRQPNPAERDGLSGLLAGAESAALELMMRRAAEFAPHAPLPYLRSVARQYRAQARRLGLLRGSAKLTADMAAQAERGMEGGAGG